MATAPKAAKRPEKTEAFSKSLHIALSIFDDQITTLSDVRKTAYENFIVAYQTAFADMAMAPNIGSRHQTYIKIG